jgi:hypothetical protein
MALRDGSWHVRLELEDQKVLTTSTDDMTLMQVDVVERVSGVPWALWDPRRSVRVAMALFVLLLVNDGTPEQQALEKVQQLTYPTLLGAFRWEPPTNPLPATAGAEERTDPPV